MNNIIEEHQQLLAQQFVNKNLPHAILIHGVEGSGKSALASWLIDLLLCLQPSKKNELSILSSCGQCKHCLLNKSKTYPDHSTLIPEKRSLGVDDIRLANLFLEKMAHIGTYKTVLIPDAQIMTIAASNALLKTLEEPSEHCVIILLTTELDNLLPTIVSRCRVLTLKTLVGNVLIDELKANNRVALLPDENYDFVNLSQLPELTDSKINENYQKFKQLYLNLIVNNSKTELQLLEQLVNNKDGLRWLEKITVNLLREQTIKPLEQGLSPELLNHLYKTIIKSSKILKSYSQANHQYILEQLIYSICEALTKDYS